MGEDVPTLSAQQLGILRDMWNPTNYGDPDKVSSANYACGSGDGGGVHTNSGVPNHAYAMLVDGKTFNGQTVEGIGFDRALAIYYRAMTVYQTPTTDFVQHADALEASCNDLIGQTINNVSTSSPNGVASADVINNHTCQQVAKALLAVEMRSPSPCPVSIILDPDEPPVCNGATDILVEDWETGMDGWMRTSTGVAADWTTDDGVPPGDDQARLRNFNVTSSIPAGGGSGSAIHGANPAVGEDGGGTCTPGGDYSGQYTIENTNPITIPAGADDLEMRFDHYVATEAGFDGAQVEVSVNGGGFVLVPESNYLFNGPNRNLTSVIDGNTNPNQGEPAWSGTNVGTPANQPPGSWGTTIIDLRSLTNPGDTIKLRFTFSQDGCNGVDGWYVDNIRIYYCAVLEAPTLSLGADYQNPDPNGSYTLTWAPRPAGATGPDVLQESSVCGPLLSDDAESGLGQWTVATGADPNEGQLVFPMWQSAPAGQKPNHSSASFWANPVSEQETQNTFTTLTFNNPIQIPSAGITTLKFSEWYFNEDDDKGFVEVSTDNGANWTAIYTNNRSMGDLPDSGASAFANEGLTPQQLDLTVYSGQTIRLRFRYALGVSNFFFFIQYGWYIDDISITNDSWVDLTNADVTSFLVSGRSNGTRCYRARTTYPGGIPSPYSNIVTAVVQLAVSPPAVDIEDDDPRVSYSNGWHLVNDSDASDGHFRLNSGKDAQHGAGLAFTATGGGKITYYFARSKKGGSAQVALLNSGGITLEARQVNYLGSVGSARDPEFNDNVYKEEFVVPAAGNYTLALRNINGAVYIDRFKLESSSSSAQPASGPGQTSSSVNTVKPGKDLLQNITVPANAQAISVMAEATPELPIQLVLIDPSGAVLSTANNSTGFAVINKNVTQPGIYVIKVVNVSVGPVQVWTAATPLVLR